MIGRNRTVGETVTLKGEKLVLKGHLPNVGQMAPDCELVGADLKAVKLSSFKGKACLVLSVPSLDTPVCSSEARHFNKEMERFKSRLNVICVSMDLPFAQARWCGAEHVHNVFTLSDYRKREFGEKYGVFIEELALLARAVFLLDSDMKVIMSLLVKETTQEPDYALIADQVNLLLASPIEGR